MSLILTLLITCQLASSPVQVDDLTDLLEPIRADAGIPALAALVIDHGEVIAIGATGVRKYGEEVPATIDDQWHLGSDTKAMTATLAAILVEEGLLRWDSTIGEVFPDLVGKIDPAYHHVTLRQLLMHRGGCPNVTFPASMHSYNLHDMPGETMIEQRLKYVELFLAGAPEETPGRRYIYSNGGYVTAGAMLGVQFAEHYAYDASACSAVLGFGAFFLTVCVVRIVGNRMGREKAYRPKIVKVLLPTAPVTVDMRDRCPV